MFSLCLEKEEWLFSSLNYAGGWTHQINLHKIINLSISIFKKLYNYCTVR
jgi:hypothetical protein